MVLRPTLSHRRPPIRAPTPAEMALELNAPISPVNVLVRWKMVVHRASAADPATIDPASM